MSIRDAIDNPSGSVAHLVEQSVPQPVGSIYDFRGQYNPDCPLYGSRPLCDLLAVAESGSAPHAVIPLHCRILRNGIVEHFFVVHLEQFRKQLVFV